jgi:hypothetical protein
MILNILLALLLIWISRQYAENMKPGALFSGWLICAGLARAFIEFFRPDQPRIGDSFVTYSMLVSLLMALAGFVMLLVRYGKLELAFARGWEEEYQIKPVEEPRVRVRAMAEDTVEEDNEEVDVIVAEAVSKPVKRKPTVKAKSVEKATLKASDKAKPVTKKKAVKPKEAKQ